MRRFGRIDRSHVALRNFARANGCDWKDTSAVGDGFPDAMVWPLARLVNYGEVLVSDRIALVEIKTPKKSTKPETAKKQAHFAARVKVWRVLTDADMLRVIQWLKQ